MIFKLWFNNLESVMPIRVIFQHEHIFFWVHSFSISCLKYLQDISCRREINLNSHPTLKSFKPWQTCFFPTKEQIDSFPFISHSKLYNDKNVCYGISTFTVLSVKSLLFVFSVFRSFLIFFNIKRVQHGKRETWKY